MVSNFFIKALGGHTRQQMKTIEQKVEALEAEKQNLEHYRDFAESVYIYTGSYPAWKAQSEYREMMAEQGKPVSGIYPGEGERITHAESVDNYLGKIVDSYSELMDKVGYSAFPGENLFWEEDSGLRKARGEEYLKANIK